MIKQLGIRIFIFAFGFATSILAESELRHLIQALFKILTNNAIHFYGKDFYLFVSPYYYLSAGFLFLIIWISWENLTTKGKILNGLMTLAIFFLSIVVVCWVDSNAKLVECTACDDGTRGIHYNDINYNAIIVISLLASIVPVGLRKIKTIRKKAGTPHEPML